MLYSPPQQSHDSIAGDIVQLQRSSSLHPQTAVKIWRTLAGLGGVVCITVGVLAMQQEVGTPSFVWSVPGLLADVFPNAAWVFGGTIIGVIGCVLVYMGLPGYISLVERLPAETHTLLAQARTSPWRMHSRSRMIAFCMIVAAYLYVIVRAFGHNADISVLVCLAGSVGLAGWLLKSLTEPSTRKECDWRSRITWGDWLAALLICLGFVLVNAHDLRHWWYAFIGDEWSFYSLAKDIAQGQSFDMLSQQGVYNIHPIANSLYQALVMRIFGLNVFGWRMSSTLSAALPILPLYWLACRMGGSIYAIAASVIYASCSVLWAFAHIGYNQNDPLLTIIPAAALLYAGLTEKRLWLVFAAGAWAGAGWYVVFTARLMIGVLVLVVLTEWRGGWRVQVRRQAALLGGFFGVVLPFIIDNGRDTIRQMFPMISLSQARTSTPAASLMLHNTVRAVYEFLYATLNAHYVVGAVFDVISAIGLCIGFVIAVRQVSTIWARLVLIWFVVTVMLTTPLYYAPQVADTRVQDPLPAAALLAALGVCSVGTAIRAVIPRRQRGPHSAFVSAWVIAVLVVIMDLNWYRFYVTTVSQLSLDPIALTIGVAQRYPDRLIILGGRLSNGNICSVLDGYEINMNNLVHFQDQHTLVPQCVPQPGSAQVPAPSMASAMVLLNGRFLDTVPSCRPVLTQVLTDPAHIQSIWAYSFTLKKQSLVVEMRQAATRAAQICPRVPALPPA